MSDSVETQLIRLERKMFQSGLGLDPRLMAQLSKDAGYFSTDPAEIKPELIAFINLIWTRMGVLTATSEIRVVSAMIGSAQDDDLEEQNG